MKKEDRLISISNVTMGVTVTTVILIVLALVSEVRGGDTYDCINAKGDYVNYGPAVVHNTQIVIAVDAARYEPRWSAMLDPEDLKSLIFEQAQHTQVLEVRRQK